MACGADLFLTADFIYWTVREDHLGFALSTGTDAAAPIKGKISQLDFKMKPGFKVGAGILFDHDGWDVFAEYTWIRARDIDGSYTVVAGEAIRGDALWHIASATAGTAASGNWSLHYFNAIDLEMGRNFYVSRYLKLRPHFGFKGTWQKQFYNVAMTVPGLVTATVNNATMGQEQFFWGVGIRAGLDAAFHFSRSFSTFGEIAVAGLWGQFEDDALVQHTNAAGAFVADVPFAPMNTGNNFHTIKPVIEWKIGLRWETYSCDKEFHFAIDAAWEEQYWLNQNQFISYHTETKLGDLVMQGFTLKFRFDF